MFSLIIVKSVDSLDYLLSLDSSFFDFRFLPGDIVV